MKIEAVVGAGKSAVGYLVYSRPGGEALIVDAPYRTSPLYMNAIQKAGLTVRYIISTHGHWDQMADNNELCEATGATLCGHVWEASRLADPRLATEDPNEKIPNIKGRTPTMWLHDSEELIVDDMIFKVMHTPGHTPGSICLYESRKQVLFVGDVMTNEGISRTDFVGSNSRKLQESLARIALLPDVTRIFPGHGTPTTLQDERWMLDLAKPSTG